MGALRSPMPFNTTRLDWCRHKQLKLWTDIELTLFSAFLPREPWCYSSLLETVKHPCIGPTLRICAAVLTRQGFSSTHSPMFPILGNQAFTPGCEGSGFRNLMEGGCFQASHFLVSNAWPTLPLLTDARRPFVVSRWQALQLLHFLKQAQDALREPAFGGWAPSTRAFSDVLFPFLAPRGFCPPRPLEMGEHIGQNILHDPEAKYYSPGTSLLHLYPHAGKETNYKILTHWYYTPTKLRRLFPEASDRCWRCQREPGSMLHIFWSCDKLQHFWQEVRRISQKMTDHPIPEDPTFFLLHCTPIPLKQYKNRYSTISSTLPRPA